MRAIHFTTRGTAAAIIVAVLAAGLSPISGRLPYSARVADASSSGPGCCCGAADARCCSLDSPCCVSPQAPLKGPSPTTGESRRAEAPRTTLFAARAFDASSTGGRGAASVACDASGVLSRAILTLQTVHVRLDA